MGGKSFHLKELRGEVAHRNPGNGRAAAVHTRAAEAKLLDAARRGDPAALEELVARISGPVWRFGQSFCRHPEDAEDVQQEVLTALVRGLDRFEGRSALSTWAFMVARNACRRLRRRRAGQPAAHVSIEDEADLIGVADGRSALDDPEQAIERGELATTLTAALRALPDGQREVLLLRDVEGLPAARVGRLLGLSERAVKSRLHRARLAVRRMLAPLRGDAGPAAGGAPRCPDTALLASRYLEGEVDARTCARLQKHVSDCPECLAACRSLRETLARCDAWGATPPPARFRKALANELAKGPKRRASGASRSPGRARPRPARGAGSR
jgi:RNA polymerase sigma-70 factor (ECF subfamily)